MATNKGRMKRLTAKAVARHLWEADGKPDGHYCGEAHRGTYVREAAAVFKVIRTLGFKVVADGNQVATQSSGDNRGSEAQEKHPLNHASLLRTGDE